MAVVDLMKKEKKKKDWNGSGETVKEVERRRKQLKFRMQCKGSLLLFHQEELNKITIWPLGNGKIDGAD